VEKILKRDFEALGELFKRYEVSFYNLAYRFTGDHYSSDDLASEIFLRIYRYLPSFKKGSQFRPWAMKVAANTCLTRTKQISNSQSQISSFTIKDETGEEKEIEIADKKINLEKDYFKKKMNERVRRALLDLPVNYRLALYFYFWEDFSYDGIARILGIPLNTVKTHIKRGKAKLKSELTGLL